MTLGQISQLCALDESTLRAHITGKISLEANDLLCICSLLERDLVQLGGDAYKPIDERLRRMHAMAMDECDDEEAEEEYIACGEIRDDQDVVGENENAVRTEAGATEEPQSVKTEKTDEAKAEDTPAAMLSVPRPGSVNARTEMDQKKIEKITMLLSECASSACIDEVYSAVFQALAKDGNHI